MNKYIVKCLRCKEDTETKFKFKDYEIYCERCQRWEDEREYYRIVAEGLEEEDLYEDEE